MKVSSVQAVGLMKRFGATLALRGVDVEFGAGLSLVEGPNGSGKSTLLGILGGVVRPTIGSVAYPPLAPTDDVRQELGWVSHDSLAYADLTGRQNIELAAEAHGLDAGDAWERASARFAIGAFAERRVRTNSRGQRQRIALARALVHDPSVILLDEPTTGLDVEGVGRLLALVGQEAERGAILIVVTHEADVFGDLVVQRVRLERGRVVQSEDELAE